jgi:hypothetical protein
MPLITPPSDNLTHSGSGNSSFQDRHVAPIQQILFPTVQTDRCFMVGLGGGGGGGIGGASRREDTNSGRASVSLKFFFKAGRR